MKNTRAATGKTRQHKVKRIPPTAESARDEGPRLLPLGDRISEPSKLEHYLDLADAALGLKDETEQRRKPTDSHHD
jgi:hypothetical protein